VPLFAERNIDRPQRLFQLNSGDLAFLNEATLLKLGAPNQEYGPRSLSAFTKSACRWLIESYRFAPTFALPRSGSRASPAGPTMATTLVKHS
jgi:hypothetical protein